jgi:hypothetical protein
MAVDEVRALPADKKFWHHLSKPTLLGDAVTDSKKLAWYHELWGYVFWLPVILVLFVVPELTAAFGASWHDLPTFSTTVGHLELVWRATALFVVLVMVFTAVNAIQRHRDDEATQRSQERRESGAANRTAQETGRRWWTGYESDSRNSGRIISLRVSERSSETAGGTDLDEELPWFVYLPLGGLVIGIGWVAGAIWADHWTLAYVVWSLIAVVVIVAPSAMAFVWGRYVPFPTLFRTVANLERRFHLVGLVVVSFIVGLLFHLAFYPWPSIAHVLQHK